MRPPEGPWGPYQPRPSYVSPETRASRALDAIFRLIEVAALTGLIVVVAHLLLGQPL